MDILSVNFPAIVVAAIAAFALGEVWYGRLMFRERWIAVNGWTAADIAAMRKGKVPTVAITFGCWLAMATALGILSQRIGINSAWGELKLALVCWAGFAVSVGLRRHMYSARRPAVFVIETGYQLASLVIMGLVIGVWR